VITSPANPLVKATAALHRRSERERTGLFLIEGTAEITRALQAGVRLERVLVAEGAELPDSTIYSWEEHAAVTHLSLAAFERIAYGRDGVAAVAVRPAFDLESMMPGYPALVLVVERIEKPGNLGAMLRTADATGASVLVADAATDLTNPNVVRASVGALFTVPVAQATAIETRSWLHNRGIAVAAATVTDGLPPWLIDLTGPIALVVGAEHTGLSKPWVEMAAHLVQIPMVGTVDSLNASTAAGVLLYEAVRQRRTGH
jgi:RNA methyltransferase, TrmH family